MTGAPMAAPPKSTTSSSVEITDVTRRFDGTTVLDRVSLTIPAGTFHCLLGPSGCGKTTLLRIVAGLDAPDGGKVVIGGADHTRTPAHRRPTNLVFQSGALFPHLSVAENVAFGLRSGPDRLRDKAEVRRRVGDILDLVAMGEFADRSPATLSGGQRQRVAIARSLVLKPDVLLLDEPLSALDLALQLRMRRELRRWQQETGTTFVCVTHNQAEAMEIADEIAVMNRGVVEQSGSARELYAAPRSRFVAGFIGENNVFDTDGSAAPEVDGLRFAGVDAAGFDALAVRPESLRLVEPGSPDARGTAHVSTTGFTGRSLRVTVVTGAGRELLVELPPGESSARPGELVGVGFAAGDVLRLRDEPGAAG
ncbi:spermidine/putrescine transport system ATP-binding protein [Actinosynnema pretiosum]|nr:spermidine/putrescine transport system ATP-binding protein [Actinosynnema pretiosum]